MVFLYQLKEGICQSSYAANIATLAGLPTGLVHRAVEVNAHRYAARDAQKHVHRLTVTLCLLRCLNITEQGSPSNALTKNLQMSRPRGQLTFNSIRCHLKTCA